MNYFHSLKAVFLVAMLLLPVALVAQETVFTFSSSSRTNDQGLNPGIFVVDGVQLTLTVSSNYILSSNGNGDWPGGEAAFPQSPVDDYTITFDQPVELKSFELYEGLDIVGLVSSGGKFTVNFELSIDGSLVERQPWQELPISGEYIYRPQADAQTTKIDKIFFRAAEVGNPFAYGKAQYVIENLVIAAVNAPPTVTDVLVSGDANPGANLTVSYTYNDEDGDDELGTTFEWSRTLIGGDGSYAIIEGATSATYSPTFDDLGYNVKATVTPGDQYVSGDPVDSQEVEVTCEAGFTCIKQEVSVCDSDSYTTPGGLIITENGSYLEEVGTIRTFYVVTFDRVDASPDVFIDAIIAQTGSVIYEANTSATGVLTFSKAEDQWVNLNALQDDLDGKNRSIFMWVKSETDAQTDDQVLFGINTASGGNVSFFFIDNSGENLELYDGGTARSASYDMGDDKWHYVGYTYNETTTETVIYVDGIENARFNNNQSVASDTQYSLGQEFDNGNISDFFNADMAEVSVWDEVLSGVEIRTAMATKVDDAHPKFASLVGYYSIFGACEDDTSILKDHSGKGNDGVLENMAIDFKNVQSVEGFNAIGWYDKLSWKKGGAEVSTASTYTTEVAAGSYEFTALRNFIQSSDTWTMTQNSNAAMVDNIDDETVCNTDVISRSVNGFNSVNYLDFEEDNDNYIEVNAVMGDLVGTNRSVFMWLNKESNIGSGDANAVFAIQGNDVEEEESRFYIRSTEKLAIYNGTSRLDATTTLGNDTWYHVGYTYDATTFETKVYVNGVAEKTGTLEMPITAGSFGSIAQRFEDNGTADFLDGKLAEVTVWNTVLSEAEVTGIMAKAPAYDATNLVAAYGTLQSIADDRVFDLTANNNDGWASHSSILVTTEEVSLANYDAGNNYTFSWKKDGTEFDTDDSADVTPDEGTTNYSINYGTPFFQNTDIFALTYTNLIKTQPTDQTGAVSGTFTFMVEEITGATYQWYRKEESCDPDDLNGSALTDDADNARDNQVQGATTHELTINNLTLDLDQAEYYVTVTKDDCPQTSEVVTLTVSNSIASVTITDASGAEDGGAIMVTAKLDNAVAGGFTVNVSTVDGTATIADSDYTVITSQTLTFTGTAGEEQTFTVLPTADTDFEDDETLTISLSNLANTALSIIISDNATLTITNDDSDDVTAPVKPVITSITDDTGESNSDGITSDSNIIISGTAEALSIVEVFSQFGSVRTTTTDANGDWSLDITDITLVEMSFNLTAEATDLAGNKSAASDVFVLTADRTAPPKPVITGITDDTGISNSDGVTNDANIIISGTAEALSSVEVFSQFGSVRTTQTDANGDWSLDITDITLVEMSFNLTAKATDLGGNSSATSDIFVLTADYTAPAKPVIIGITDDTGSSNSDGVTNDANIMIIGTAEALSSVEVFSQFGSVRTTQTDANGDWSLDITDISLVELSFNLTAKATDLAGNASATSDIFVLTADRTAPAKPVITSITDDTGSSNSDGITNDSNIIISGTAEALSSVEVFSQFGTVRTTQTDVNGDWSLDITDITLVELSFNLTAEATDLAGNASAASDIFVLTADRTAPAKPVITSITDDTGNSNSDGITNDANIIISGTAEALSNVEVFTQFGSVRTTQTDVNGDWSLDITDITLVELSFNLTAEATDLAGNASATSDVFVLTADFTSPGVAIDIDNNSVAGYLIRATFDEDVSGLELSEISVTGGTASDLMQISPDSYSFLVNSSGSTADVIINTNTAQDLAGNHNTASNQLTLGFTPQSAREDFTNLSNLSKTEEVNIYPNPASKILTIDLSELSAEEVNIYMHDAAGIPVFTKEAYKEKTLRLDVSNYTSGVYIMQFYDGNQVTRKKVMVKK